MTAKKVKKPPSDLLVKNLGKITIIYNAVKNLENGEPDDILADEDTIKTVNAIYSALKKEEINVELFEVNEENYTDLLTYDTSFYFNLCYGIGSIPKTEQEIPRLLEKTGVPYTGATEEGIKLTTDKIATKKIFQSLKVPTPEFEVFTERDRIVNGHLGYPLFVKPSLEDCSLGVHSDAVVTNEKQLETKVSRLLKEYHEPILVEKFINTREISVTIIGNDNDIEVLPYSEIIFGESFENNRKWKIVDFDAKWKADTSNYKDTVGVCPAVLKKDVYEKIKEYAIKAYKACGCRDYARMDIRLDEDEVPYFLEINLNPGIGPDDGAIRSAKVAGYNYTNFLKKLIDVSLSRYN